MKYLLKRTVDVTPCKRGDAYSEIDLGFSEEESEDNGFIVRDPKGREEWMSEKDFCDACSEHELSKYETHLDRMAVEMDDVRERKDRLAYFIHEHINDKDISPIQTTLLLMQHDSMMHYLDVLANRSLVMQRRNPICSRHSMDFGTAILAMRNGLPVRRFLWPKDTFLIKPNSNTVTPDIIPGMTSLPDDVKNVLSARPDSSILYHSQIFKVSFEGIHYMITCWSPRCEDILSGDWVILTKDEWKETVDTMYPESNMYALFSGDSPDIPDGSEAQEGGEK